MLTLTLKLMCLMSVALKCLTFYSVIWKHEMVLGGVFSIIDKCASPPPPQKKYQQYLLYVILSQYFSESNTESTLSSQNLHYSCKKANL